jgi:hypothetical protein
MKMFAWDYKAEELSEAKYAVEGFELRQVVAEGKEIKQGAWAMFGSYEENGERIYWMVEDDFGAGNIDDESWFSYRVEMVKEEIRIEAAHFAMNEMMRG